MRLWKNIDDIFSKAIIFVCSCKLTSRRPIVSQLTAVQTTARNYDNYNYTNLKHVPGTLVMSSRQLLVSQLIALHITARDYSAVPETRT